jgi:hypothetical protein
MDTVTLLLSLPADLEAWLILGYVAVVLAGARICEALAKIHFERARRYAERGFEYDAAEDHYRCPQGERLSLHLIEPDNRVAVYRAPASRCNGCPSKAACTPHDEGRHIYRPLAAWAETDIGRFHRRLSVLMFGVGVVLSLVGLARWGGRQGTGLLLLALSASLASVLFNLGGLWAAARTDLDQEDESGS